MLTNEPELRFTNSSSSANRIKLVIVFNAMSILAIVTLFELLKFAENKIWLAGLELILVITALITFYNAYWQTGLWRLPPSNKNLYINWVNFAKREKTRSDRISKVVEYCAGGIKPGMI